MENVKTGIAVAGSVLVDKIYTISAYPESGQLTQIQSIQKAVGGCVPNVALDLKKLSPELPIYAVGTVGADDDGTFVTQVLKEGNVNTDCLTQLPESTSFTDVMSVQGGQRTFFTYAGASGQFGAEHVPFDKIDPKLLHLGYFLLLSRVDEGEGIKILKEAKARGIETSIDLVSENSDRYPLVRPCLAYTDYLIVNEFEAGKLADTEPTAENLPAITQKLMDMGVQKMVVIHMPEKAVCRSKNGYFTLGSHILPEGFIQGTTGAGDAFCAGALLGIYNGWSEEEILEFASCSAVMALRRPDATSGLQDAEMTRAFCKDFNRRKI